MNKYGCLVCAVLFAFTAAQAQIDEEIDSTEIVGLDNVVITGQYSAQSIDKSIYQVEVISQQDIKNMAGNTVADVLNQNLNILITPNGNTGDSQAQIMGLGGEYTKILVDNIPLVGDNGMGISIDLTKINLDNVERIEIVKGAMGVDYGNNALAGVINIITKKSNKNKWKVNAMIQEETVGNEYDWYGDAGVSKGKGRHIQALEISHNISDKWFVSAGANRNDFQGFWADRKGKKYTEKDGLRGYEWLPKEQWNANGLLSYKSKNFKAFYKFNYLNEEINFYNPVVGNHNYGEGVLTYKSIDRDYSTERFSHHLNVEAKLFDRVQYNGDFSIQSQDRKFRDYQYDIPNRVVISEDDYASYMSSDAFYSRGTFSNFLNKDKLDFQVGYELDNTKGYINSAAGFAVGNNIEKRLETYAAFASAEVHTNSGLSLRPGFRASFSSKFDTQLNYSLSAKYSLSSNSDIRLVAGTANRFPDFEELYTYYVDSNHQVLGDENLNPENGYSTTIQWNHRYNGNGFKLINNISTIYMNVDDRIESVVLNYFQNIHQMMNIDKYQSWGIMTSHNLKVKDFNFNVGGSLLGISKKLSASNFSNEGTLEDEFRYTLELNAAANYTFQKFNTTLSLYYKYAGKTTEFVVDETNSTPELTLYRLGEREGFSLLDFSVRKGFFNNDLELTLGARNLLDITSIRNTAQTGGAHNAAAAQMPLFYGRSYFLKLNYNLNFN